MTTYFLFGETASKIYLYDGFLELLKEIEDLDFEIYKHQSFSTALDLLEAYDGWNGYAVITEKEYNKLKKLL